MFGIFLGIGFGDAQSEGNHVTIIDDPLYNSLLIGPIEILGGIFLGVLVGLLLRFLHPIKHKFKAVITLITSTIFVFGSGVFGIG